MIAIALFGCSPATLETDALDDETPCQLGFADEPPQDLTNEYGGDPAIYVSGGWFRRNQHDELIRSVGDAQTVVLTGVLDIVGTPDGVAALLDTTPPSLASISPDGDLLFRVGLPIEGTVSGFAVSGLDVAVGWTDSGRLTWLYGTVESDLLQVEEIVPLSPRSVSNVAFARMDGAWGLIWDDSIPGESEIRFGRREPGSWTEFLTVDTVTRVGRLAMANLDSAALIAYAAETDDTRAVFAAHLDGQGLQDVFPLDMEGWRPDITNGGGVFGVTWQGGGSPRFARVSPSSIPDAESEQVWTPAHRYHVPRVSWIDGRFAVSAMESDASGLFAVGALEACLP